ncbi:MAG: OmpH family outer membrane protein [Bacteroidetes bacterium]|nr:OmpH family outer membrane protein [Bacteroidota bacterium]
MKKVLLAAVCVTALSFGGSKINAQTGSAFKVGVFDIDLMVRALPDYRAVDSLTQLYERDTLGSEYQVYLSEWHRLDSTLQADSAKGSIPKSVMDYNNQQKQQMGMQLTYWQQIAQNKSDQYRSNLSAPLYQKVVAAYKKVLTTKKYNLILKPDSYEVGFPIENMFPLVAKEMNVTLPPGLLVDPNQALNDAGAASGKN